MDVENILIILLNHNQNHKITQNNMFRIWPFSSRIHQERWQKEDRRRDRSNQGRLIFQSDIRRYVRWDESEIGDSEETRRRSERYATQN